MFGMLSERLRAVAGQALLEAERRGDRHTGTEHFIVALIGEAETELAAALDRTDVTAQRCRDELGATDASALAAAGVDPSLLDGVRPREPEPLPSRWRSTWRRVAGAVLTEGAMHALNDSERIARAHRARRVDLEHFAAALARRDDRDPGVALLRRLDLDAPRLAAALAARAA